MKTDTESVVGSQLILSPLLPAIIDDLSLSSTTAGLGLSIMWACTALCHYPGGRLSDALTRKSLLVPGIGLMFVGVVVFVAIPTVPAFFLGLVLLGVGTGMYTPVAFAQLSDLYVRHRGLALGINTASLNLGGLFGAGLAVVSTRFLGWRDAFVPLGLTLFVVLVAFHRYNTEEYAYAIAWSSIDLRATVARLTRTLELRWTLVAAVIFGFVWQAILSFLPTYLHVEKGFTPTTSGVLFGCIFLIGTLTTPLAGFWPAVNTHLIDIFPEGRVGGDYGAIRTVFIASESVGPLYLGAVGDHFSYSLGFSSLLVALVSTIVLTGVISVRFE